MAASLDSSGASDGEWDGRLASISPTVLTAVKPPKPGAENGRTVLPSMRLIASWSRSLISVVLRNKVDRVVKDDRNRTLLRGLSHQFQEIRQLLDLRRVCYVFALGEALNHDGAVIQQ